MSQSVLHLRRALPCLAALRHSLSSSALLNSSVTPSLSQHTSFFLTSIFQLRPFTSHPTVSLSSSSKSAALPDGMDFNHWVIYMDFGDKHDDNPEPTPEELVRLYEKTCAKGLNISLEEAKQRIYACTTANICRGFQAVMTEEDSDEILCLRQVKLVVPDSYVDPEKKDYGGDKYINGKIIPRNSSAVDLLKKLSSAVDFLKKVKGKIGYKKSLMTSLTSQTFGFVFWQISNAKPVDLQILQIGLHIFRVYEDEFEIFFCSSIKFRPFIFLHCLLEPCADYDGWFHFEKSLLVSKNYEKGGRNADDFNQSLWYCKNLAAGGWCYRVSDYIKMYRAYLASADVQSDRKLLSDVSKDSVFYQMVIKKVNYSPLDD